MRIIALVAPVLLALSAQAQNLDEINKSCQPNSKDAYGVGERVKFNLIRPDGDLSILKGDKTHNIFVGGHYMEGPLGHMPLDGRYLGNIKDTFKKSAVSGEVFKDGKLGLQSPEKASEKLAAEIKNRKEDKIVITCHNAGCVTSLMMLEKLDESSLKKVNLVMLQPAIGGSEIADKGIAAGATNILKWFISSPMAEAMKTDVAMKRMQEKSAPLCKLIKEKKIPVSLIVSAATEEKDKNHKVIKMFNSLSAGGISENRGSCSFNDRFVHANTAAMPCGAVNHFVWEGSHNHVPFFKPGSTEATDVLRLIAKAASAERQFSGTTGAGGKANPPVN